VLEPGHFRPRSAPSVNFPQLLRMYLPPTPTQDIVGRSNWQPNENVLFKENAKKAYISTDRRLHTTRFEDSFLVPYYAIRRFGCPWYCERAVARFVLCSLTTPGQAESVRWSKSGVFARPQRHGQAEPVSGPHGRSLQGGPLRLGPLLNRRCHWLVNNRRTLVPSSEDGGIDHCRWRTRQLWSDN